MASSRLTSSFGRSFSRSSGFLRGSGSMSNNNHHFMNVVRYMSVINLSDFEATEKFTQLNHKSVLYFTATWCPPCKSIKPVYEELSTKYPDVAFGKIDVDDNSDAALEFNITSVPTFVFFDGEDILQRFSGADPKMLENILQELDAKK